MQRAIFRQYVDGSTGAVVRFTGGEVLFARYSIPPGIRSFAEIRQRASDRLIKVTFTTDVLATLYDFDMGRLLADHVTFVRQDRKAQSGGGLDFVRRPNRCPFVQEAFLRCRVPVIHALDGFAANAVAYDDEFVVLGESNSSGWIVPKSRVGEYMMVLKPPVGIALPA